MKELTREELLTRLTDDDLASMLYHCNPCQFQRLIYPGEQFTSSAPAVRFPGQTIDKYRRITRYESGALAQDLITR